MVEWSITAVLKTVELRGSGGSNPSLSANNLKLSAKRWAFFVQARQELAPVRACAEKDHRPSGRELQIACKGPSGEEGGMWRTKCGKSHVYLPTSSAAKLMTKAESLLDIGYYRLGFFLHLKWISAFYIFDENDKNVK